MRKYVIIIFILSITLYAQGGKILVGLNSNILIAPYGFTVGYYNANNFGINASFKTNLTMFDESELHGRINQDNINIITSDVIDDTETVIGGDLSFNLPLISDIHFYLGISVYYINKYIKYYTDISYIEERGYFWIKDKNESSTYIGAALGIHIPASDLFLFTIGGNVNPGAVTLGVGLTL